MIKIKSATQIEQMKKAGALSKMALRHVGAMVRPGVSPFELDQLAEQIIRMHGGTPAFKGYGGFPGTICASINDAVVHGIPNPDMILRDGDIISIDIPNSKVNVNVSDEELEARRAKYVPREPNVKSGWLYRYSRLVTSADQGAVVR